MVHVAVATVQDAENNLRATQILAVIMRAAPIPVVRVPVVRATFLIQEAVATVDVKILVGRIRVYNQEDICKCF